MDDSIQTIPLAAHESAMVRDHKLVKWLVIGWAASVLVMCAVFGSIIYAYATAEYDVVTETTTTETTESVAQDSGDSGSNIYAGGDVNGYAAGN